MMNEKEWIKASYLHGKNLVDFKDKSYYDLTLEYVPSVVGLAKDYVENVLGGTFCENGNSYITIFNGVEGFDEVINRPFSCNIPQEVLNDTSKIDCCRKDGSYLVCLPEIFDYGFEHGSEYCINIFEAEAEAKKFIDSYEEDERFEDFSATEDVSSELKKVRKAEFRRIMKKYRELKKESH